MLDLDLTTLAVRADSISPYLVATYVEAASVVLEKLHTVPPHQANYTWHQDATARNGVLTWLEVDDRTRRTHGNNKDATEYGAYAVAIAAMTARGYRLLGRLHQGSGADYYMVKDGEPEENYIKLEVSGIFSNGDLFARLREKIEQGGGGNLRRPGVAVVVKFQQPAVAVGGWS